MDGLTFTAEMTKAIAWPAGAIAIAALVRRPVSLLLDGLRLQRLKVAGVEAEFSREWAETALQVASEARALPVVIEPGTKQLDAIALMTAGTHEDPLAVIIRTWGNIEARVREALKEASVASKNIPFRRMIDDLVKANRISAATAEGLRGLSQLRNLAVHAPNDASLAARLPEFRAMADAMLWSLEHELKAGRSGSR